jgi:hypothetical protein
MECGRKRKTEKTAIVAAKGAKSSRTLLLRRLAHNQPKLRPHGGGIPMRADATDALPMTTTLSAG